MQQIKLPEGYNNADLMQRPKKDVPEKDYYKVTGKQLTKDPLEVQVGGAHYNSKGIQPIEYIFANNLGFCEGNIIKYVTRYKEKNGIEDLEKSKHYLDLLISELKGN